MSLYDTCTHAYMLMFLIIDSTSQERPLYSGLSSPQGNNDISHVGEIGNATTRSTLSMFYSNEIDILLLSLSLAHVVSIPPWQNVETAFSTRCHHLKRPAKH